MGKKYVELFGKSDGCSYLFDYESYSKLSNKEKRTLKKNGDFKKKEQIVIVND